MKPAAITAALDLLNRQNNPQQFATPGDLAAALDPRTRQTAALDLIDAELVRLTNTPDGRLIVSMPPQEGKSTRVMDFIMWRLLANPNTRVATASYAQNLANRNGRKLRNTITAHPELGLTIARDNGSVSEWQLHGHEGGVLSVGRGAGITGRPVDLLVIDDPLKDRAEADSQTIRDTCWDWWTDSLSTRLSPGAPVVVILTRWHEDDLAARLTNGPDGHVWRVVNIPAQAEHADDPLGRQPGDFLDSARGRTIRQWEAIKTRVGPRTWASLYQGHPSPPEGGVFRRDYWQHWDTPPYVERDGQHLLTGGMLVQSWDLSFKATQHSDYVVGQVWWFDGTRSWLLDQVRGRWGFNETCQHMLTLSARWPQATAKYVEDKANGPAVIDALRLKLPGLVPVEPQGGKEVRAAAVEPLLASGSVLLPPLTVPWVSGLIEEAAGFPNASHDDQVDALTQALTRIYLTVSHLGTLTNYDLG